MYKFSKIDTNPEKFIDRIRNVSAYGSSGLSIIDALFNPQYRKATWISMTYIMLTQLTGFNVIN